MTYSYDRRAAADPDLAFLEDYVRRARPIPALAAPVARLLKTPLIDQAIDKMRDMIRNMDDIIELLKNPSKENDHKANLLIRKINVDIDDLPDWGLSEFIPDTGLSKRLWSMSPIDDDRSYRLFWDTNTRLIKRTKAKLRDK